MQLKYRVVLAHLRSRCAGVNLNRLKSHPEYTETRKELLSLWDREGLSAIVPNQSIRDRIIASLTHFYLSDKNEVQKDLKDIFVEIHDMAVANQLAIFDKINDQSVFSDFKQSLKSLKDTREKKKSEYGISGEDEEDFNRVKVIKNIGGYKWVMALDKDGKPCGFMPKSVTNKTMNHCGNEPSVKPGDTYYELRDNSNKPHLTVITDNNSKIKESKGHSNNVPRNKVELMPAMKWLMTQRDLVKGTSYGEGYARDKNFSISLFIGYDDEFVSLVEREYPYLIDEDVDRPIMVYKRKIKSGDLSKEGLIKKWESSDGHKDGLNLEILRGILGEDPLSESEMLKNIESGRLQTAEIGNADVKYLTPRVQTALLKKDQSSYKVLLSIHDQVPSAKILVGECIEKAKEEIVSNGWNDGTGGLSEPVKKKLLQDPNIIPILLKSIESKGWGISTSGISESMKEKLLQDQNIIQTLLKGIESKGWSSGTRGLPESIKEKLLQDQNIIHTLVKGIESGGWYYGTSGIPEPMKEKLLQDPNIIPILLKGIESKGWGSSTSGIPESMKEKLLQDQSIIHTVLKSIESKGWHYGTIDLPESTKKKLLQDQNIFHSVLKGIESRGWDNGTNNLPEDLMVRLLNNSKALEILYGDINKVTNFTREDNIFNIFNIHHDLVERYLYRKDSLFMDLVIGSIDKGGLGDIIKKMPEEILDNVFNSEEALIFIIDYIKSEGFKYTDGLDDKHYKILLNDPRIVKYLKSTIGEVGFESATEYIPESIKEKLKDRYPGIDKK